MSISILAAILFLRGGASETTNLPQRASFQKLDESQITPDLRQSGLLWAQVQGQGTPPPIPPSSTTPAPAQKQTANATPAQTPDQIAAEKKHQQDMQDDREAGKRMAAEADKELKPSDDKEATARVQRIGKVLADLANKYHTVASWGDTRMNTYEYTFKLVKGSEVNAFSIPGGYIYVYEGLVKFVETDDELAGVLAHEISHAKFRHIATLDHDEKQLQKVTLPLVLLAILTGGVGAVAPALGTSGLVSQAEGSGWSVKAESAADYGGLQLLEHSPWNPTGILSMMERLAATERFHPELKDLGILRDHPPSRERAQALIQHMNDAGVPIQRSAVTTSFRTTWAALPGGQTEIKFGTRHLTTLAGPGSDARAQTAADRLNQFFDQTPELYEVSAEADGWVMGRGKPLIKFTSDDATFAKTSIGALQTEAISNIRRGLYSLGFRIWDVQ